MTATAANPFPNWQPGAGIYFTPGKGFAGKDFYKTVKDFKIDVAPGTESPATTPSVYGAGQALPDSSAAVKYQLDVAKGLLPLQRQLMLDAAQLQQQQNEQGFASAYPWITQAANEATARNLAASQAYRSFAEGLPSNVQNIMASKQAQMTSAAGAEADRARAMAAQTQAAKDFAGRYSGQYINVG
jgi:hypothetical protein